MGMDYCLLLNVLFPDSLPIDGADAHLLVASFLYAVNSFE